MSEYQKTSRSIRSEFAAASLKPAIRAVKKADAPTYPQRIRCGLIEALMMFPMSVISLVGIRSEFAAASLKRLVHQRKLGLYYRIRSEFAAASLKLVENRAGQPGAGRVSAANSLRPH